jgi:hypothetical protein
MAEYALGRRLAMRVRALLAKRVDVTATVLASATDDPAVSAILLAPEMLRDPASLDEAALQRRARLVGLADADLIRFVDSDDGWRTIALEDDVLAAELNDGTDNALTLAASRDGTAPDDELAHLRLVALTAPNSDDRVAALRELSVGAFDGGLVAGVLLQVLVDPQAEQRVRLQALQSFEQIGLRPELAQPLRGLFEPDGPDASWCIQRLTNMLPDADDAEAMLVLAVVLEALQQPDRPAATYAALIRVMATRTATLATAPDRLQRFLRTALRHLERDYDALIDSVEPAVAACTESAPDATAELLWSELQHSGHARVRALLLNTCEGLAQTPERATQLARRAVREILNPHLPEAEKGRLRFGLLRLGEAAAQAVLAALPEAHGGAAAELGRLLDVLCTEGKVGDDIVRAAVEAVLNILKLSDTATRRSVLGAALLWDERAGDELLARVATQVLALSAELSLPDSADMVQHALERIGPPALTPAFDFMTRHYPDEHAQRAAQSLAVIVQQMPEAVTDELAAALLDFGRAQLEHDESHQGGFVLVMAAVCGYTAHGRGASDEVFTLLRTNVGQRSWCMDALQALGSMSSAPNATPLARAEALELFDAIVQARGQGSRPMRQETPDGIRYEFGSDIEFDTRAIPAAVRGLEQIFLHPATDAETRVRIVRRMLVLWEGVTRARLIWGPAATQALVQAMSRIACSPVAGTQIRDRLGTSLLRCLSKLSVVAAVGELCARPDSDPDFLRLTYDALDQVLDEWETSDPRDDERRIALLCATGQIAANSVWDADDTEVQTLRRRALEALYAGLREGIAAVRTPLLLMRDCPGLPESDREDIDTRLSRAFGLTHVER